MCVCVHLHMFISYVEEKNTLPPKQPPDFVPSCSTSHPGGCPAGPAPDARGPDQRISRGWSKIHWGMVKTLGKP